MPGIDMRPIWRWGFASIVVKIAAALVSKVHRAAGDVLGFASIALFAVTIILLFYGYFRAVVRRDGWRWAVVEAVIALVLVTAFEWWRTS